MATQKQKKTASRVLVVEDDFFLIKVLQSKLTQAGFEVQVAVDGIVALDILRGGFHPELILLDLVMPRKDGFEVLEEMSLDTTLKKIPVIILTNLGQQSDIDRAQKYGVRQYLVKSDLSIDEVVKVVQKEIKK